MYVGGLPPGKARYRFRVHTIEGLMDDRAKQGVIRDLTRLTLEIEGSPLDVDNLARVWCLLREYPRANWGIAGVPFAPSGYLSAANEIAYADDQPID
jgi:phenylpyruvate tautomerase PptA (4-oxalocrotonate tautomerase family)